MTAGPLFYGYHLTLNGKLIEFRKKFGGLTSPLHFGLCGKIFLLGWKGDREREALLAPAFLSFRIFGFSPGLAEWSRMEGVSGELSLIGKGVFSLLGWFPILVECGLSRRKIHR